MSLSKGLVFIGIGAGALVIVYNKPIMQGVVATSKAVLAAHKDWLNLSGFVADIGNAKDTILNPPQQTGLPGNFPQPTSTSSACDAAKATCKQQYAERDPQYLVCLTNMPGNPCYPGAGQGGPLAGYYVPHGAGMGSVIYHA